MMRVITVAFAFGLVLAVLNSELARADNGRQRLDGWGPFKFGMSLLEARNASQGTAQINRYGVLEYLTKIGDRTFLARLKFSGDGAHLVGIGLDQYDLSGLPDEEVGAAYERDVTDVAVTYGVPDRHDPRLSITP